MIPLFLMFSFLLGLMPPIEGVTHNFSVSFSSMSPFVVQSYGAMKAYVAYMANTSSAFVDPSAWLLFIPHPPSNASYVLAAYVFAGSSLVEEGAIVWMANRQRPVSGNFSLTLNQSLGELVLLDGDGSLAWVSNNSYTASGVVSMDLKTNLSGDPPIGTLVLYDASNTTLWQSSKHPTHALVSNQVFEFGMNLVSWASPTDSSEGLYSLVMEAGGLVLFYNGSVPYWGWSYDDRNDSFGIIGTTHTCRNLTRAVMDPKGGIMLQITTNLAPLNLTLSDMCPSNSSNNTGSLEAYFGDYGSSNNSDVTFLQLQQDGNLVASTLGTHWVTVYDLFAENRCLLPNVCGPYGVCTGSFKCICPPSSDGSFPLLFPPDSSEGCQLTHNLSCSSASKQKLLPLSGVDYFANKYSSPLNLPTEQMCQDACLQNCSCVAAFWHVHSSSCFHVNDVIGSLQGSLNSSYMAYVKVKDLAESKTNVRLIAGLVSGVAALLIIMILAAFIYRKQRADARQQMADVEIEPEEEDPFWNTASGLPSRYSYKELQSITNGFSEQLGKGGFGTVYAGVLQDGTKVAVKRLESLKQGTKQFRAEVLILGAVHHYNLVELIGFCSESTHRLLVYEYMANGSLDQWLFAREKLSLEWKHRFNIALGAARGLAYLHGECRDTILHLDIKPQNILLDENFVAKVSDFGLSTLMGRDESHVITTMRGTPGYLAPEWLSEGSEVSAKCDVFSFGKLLMEILGGRKNLDPSVGERDRVYFPSWLYLQITHEGEEADLSHIAGVETSEEMRQARLMLKTAFLCVLDNPAQRPTMEKVVHMLQGGVRELESLELSDLFQGLQSALRMPSPSLAHSRMEEALAPLYRSLSLKSGSLQGGVMSSIYISGR